MKNLLCSRKRACAIPTVLVSVACDNQISLEKYRFSAPNRSTDSGQSRVTFIDPRQSGFREGEHCSEVHSGGLARIPGADGGDRIAAAHDSPPITATISPFVSNHGE
jgi:hypothetical protein